MPRNGEEEGSPRKTQNTRKEDKRERKRHPFLSSSVYSVVREVPCSYRRTLSTRFSPYASPLPEQYIVPPRALSATTAGAAGPAKGAIAPPTAIPPSAPAQAPRELPAQP